MASYTSGDTRVLKKTPETSTLEQIEIRQIHSGKMYKIGKDEIHSGGLSITATLLLLYLQKSQGNLLH
jgi:hypothetical protein